MVLADKINANIMQVINMIKKTLTLMTIAALLSACEPTDPSAKDLKSPCVSNDSDYKSPCIRRELVENKLIV